MAKLSLFIPLLLLLSTGTPFLVQAQSAQPSVVQVIKVQTETSESADKIIAPQYQGGEDEMLKLLAMNARYPSKAQITKKVGRAIMQVTIDEAGKTSNIKAAYTDNPLFEKEGMRVLKLMPKWEPAKNNGTPVSSTYLFPFTFKMSGADGNEMPLPENNTKEVSEKISADASAQPVFLVEEVVIVGYGVSRSR